MAFKTLTSSSIGCFGKCPRCYFYRYCLGRVTIRKADHFSIGDLWHLAMESFWLGIKSGMSDDEARGAAAHRLKADADMVEPKHAAMLSAMLVHYNPPHEDYEVLGVEEKFCGKIEHPITKRGMYAHRIQGKIDVVLRQKSDGKIFICDHKTTTNEIIGYGPYWQGLQVDGQMNIYCLHKRAGGFIYDAARKLNIKPKSAIPVLDENGHQIHRDVHGNRVLKKDGTPYANKPKHAKTETREETMDEFRVRCISEIAEAPAEYFQWRVHVKDENDFQEARMDLYQNAQMLHACEKYQHFPRRSSSCRGFFGVCEYLDVCTGRARIDDDALFRTKDTAHEELAA